MSASFGCLPPLWLLHPTAGRLCTTRKRGEWPPPIWQLQRCMGQGEVVRVCCIGAGLEGQVAA